MGRVAALACVFAVAFEATCRLEDFARYGTPLFTRYTSQTDLIVRDARGSHGRANARYEKWVMNDLGLRGPPVAAGKADGTLRVVATGASETFGLYESPDREYPRQLEDSLARVVTRGAACTGAPWRRAEVLNAALPGMTLPTLKDNLRAQVAPLHPDIVVVYATPPQYLDDRLPSAALPDSSPRAGAIAAARALRPRALDRLRAQTKELLPRAVGGWLRARLVREALAGTPPGWRFDSVPPERLALYDAHLRAVVGTIRAIGAEPLLVTHANAFQHASGDEVMLAAWERFYPRAPGRTIVAFDAAARSVTLRVARDSSVAALDLAALPLGTSDFADFSHFTDSGAATVAGAIARAIVSSRCSSPPTHLAATSGPRVGIE